MNTIDNNELAEIVITALEKTCFLIADEVTDEDRQRCLDTITKTSKIQYTGASSGTVYVDASDGFLQELASCMLGTDPDEIDPAVDGVSAGNEIANIIAGSVLYALGGDHGDFKLGIPETGTINREGIAAECILESAFGAVHVHWNPDVAQSAKAA